MSNAYRRVLDSCGKGGVRCPCCNMYAGRRSRKRKAKWTRIVRCRLKKLTLKEINESSR